MICKNISALINFYLENDYITQEDVNYTFNRLLKLINKQSGEYYEKEPANLYDSLNTIIDYCVKNKVIEDFNYQREELEAIITDTFIPRPSDIIKECNEMGIKKYIQKFLNLSIDTNYVKANDLKENKRYMYTGSKGNIEISINLAKPEKDIKEIQEIKRQKGLAYPKCPLCKENVGFYGNISKAARSNLRIVPMNLNNTKWYFQYSPYMYYNEHCIVFTEEHVDMKVDNQTIKYQFDFIDQINHYFIGTNADIPIVGGSILNHNHFQGGNYNFSCESSKKLYEEYVNDVKVEYLDWYLQTLRLISPNKKELINLVNRIQDNFKTYENKEINLFNENNNNAVNIISKKENSNYIVYIILRNNMTSVKYPFGIFHPDESLHNIKKENIGLIEAMGVAILPGRLVKEQVEIKNYILEKPSNVPKAHINFAQQLKAEYTNENIDDYIDQKIGQKFEEVLKCCDILKYESSIQRRIKIIRNLYI